MAQFEPFEPRPIVAVAVSGGPDSTALFLLARVWAEARKGSAIALVVDHGLREESAQEAAAVAQALRLRGASATVLRWDGEKPRTGVQAAARAARYRLLVDACRKAGIVHLLLGHQADDQRETVAERLSAGSGIEGLAGVAAVVEMAHVRLLRPLLGVPRAALAAFSTNHGLVPIDDPSNRDPRFARARWRLAALPDGLEAASTTASATRRALERAVAAAMVRCVALHPAGCALIDARAFAALPAGIRMRLLGSVLRCVSGAQYAAARATLDGAAARLAALGGAGFTVGGCRLLVRAGSWLAVRETRNLRGVDADGLWDGRISLPPSACAPVARGRMRKGAEQAAVWRRMAAIHGGGLAAARAALPADESGPVLLKIEAPQGAATFRPRRALAEASFSPCNAWPSPQFSHIRGGE